MALYMTRENGSSRAHKKWVESPISMQIDGFSPLARVNKPGTNSVLFQICFVFVSLNKNLSFGVFKIKMVQSHKNTINTKPFGFEFKF